MYMNKMITVGKAENGYVVETHVPIKAGNGKENDDVKSEYRGSCEKKYVAKDSMEVLKIITSILPLLDGEYKSEGEFDSAFAEASGGKDKKE